MQTIVVVPAEKGGRHGFAVHAVLVTDHSAPAGSDARKAQGELRRLHSRRVQTGEREVAGEKALDRASRHGRERRVQPAGEPDAFELLRDRARDAGFGMTEENRAMRGK